MKAIVYSLFIVFPLTLFAQPSSDSGDTIELNSELISAAIERDGRMVIPGLFFEMDESALLKSSEPAISALAIYLAENDDKNFYLVAHSNDEGRLETNMLVSVRRAEAVVSALLDKGIEQRQLKFMGVGPFSPIASNKTEAGRLLNERVELVLRLRT